MHPCFQIVPRVHHGLGDLNVTNKTNKLPSFINRFTKVKFIDPTRDIEPNLHTNVIFHSKYVVKGIGGAPSRTIWSHVLRGVH